MGEKIKNSFYRLEHYVWLLAIVWTAVVVASLLWNLAQTRHNTLKAARIQARTAHEKDVTYRRWNAGHGGVYVPVTETTHPNPYLSHLDERDITTLSGKKLTLMNPAYMTRQVHEQARAQFGVRGHITSLRPIRPENAPDPWEAKALRAFELGETEISSLEQIEHHQYMRLMRPLVTEKGCLKCHADQGYRQGDIRGGISVSVPMEPLWAIAHANVLALTAGHALLWLVGLGAGARGARRLKNSESKRRRVQEALEKANETLETKVEVRTSELRIVNDRLRTENAERKHAEKDLQQAYANLEKQSILLAQTEKMSAIGTLVAGTAHELNNPLTAVLNFSAHCRKHTSRDDELYPVLEDIEHEAKRCADIVQNLTTFSDIGQDDDVYSKASLAKIIGRVFELLSWRIENEEISTTLDVAEDTPDIWMNATAVQQLILNLTNNALDALKDSDKKELNVDVSRQGEFVRMTFADTGCGIEDGSLKSIFDPFFTTKPVGQGVGLGLSACQGIIKAHGGQITCQSKLGAGMKFIILLPIERSKQNEQANTCN